MPRIKMKITTQGSSDGFTVGVYEQGKEYDVSPRLAQNFCIQQGIAEPVRRRKAEPGAPDNKMVSGSPDNKADKDKTSLTRVFQLADELGVSSKEVIDAAKKCEVVVTAPASGLSDEEVGKIRAVLAK